MAETELSPQALPAQLKQQVEAGRVVVVLGSGYHLGGLAQHLAQACGYSRAKLLLPDVAMSYQDRMSQAVSGKNADRVGRDQLIGHCHHWLKDHPLADGWIAPLAQAPIFKFISLLYTGDLEQALTDAGRPPHSFSEDTHLYTSANPNLSEVKVFRPFGDMDISSSLLITADDHRALAQSKPQLLAEMRRMFADHTILLVGCRPDDEAFHEDFSNLFRELAGEDNDLRGRYYYALPVSAQPNEAQAWANLNPKIQILTASPAHCLTELARLRRVKTDPRQVVIHGIARPYKFLDYYERQDAGLFFGRSREIEAYAAQILAETVTVLCGRSGTGKTSLIQAGLMPHLESAGCLTVYARPGLSPNFNPEDILRASVREALREANLFLPSEPPQLDEFLKAVAQTASKKLVIFLDQFEELFTRLDKSARNAFARALQSCVYPTLQGVRLVIALREDYLADLDSLKRYLPGLQKFEHTNRLQPLTDEEAKEAICEPARAFGFEMETGLAQTLLKDLQTMRGIEPAQLSIVCDRLWIAAQTSNTPKRLTYTSYQKLGGARGILAGYLKQALADFSKDDLHLAQAILDNLVTQFQTKAALTQPEALAGLEPASEAVLQSLVRTRLVRALEQSRTARYELAHECLIETIQQWTDPQEKHRKTLIATIRQGLALWRSHPEIFLGSATLEQVAEDREKLRPRLLPSERTFLALSATCALPIRLEDWGCAGNMDEDLLVDALCSSANIARRAALNALGELDVDTKDTRNTAAARRQRDISDGETPDEVMTKTGWQPGQDPVSAAYWCALGEYTRCIEIGEPAIHPLIKLLSDNDPAVGQVAANALSKIGWQPGQDQTGAIYWCILGQYERCVEIGTPAIKSLIVRLVDQNENTRRESATALGKIGNTRAVEPLIARLRDGNKSVRWAAVQALGNIRDTRAIEPLIAQLEDENESCWVAAQALIKIGAPAVESLIIRLRDSKKNIREETAKVLGEIRDTRAVEPLVAQLEDDDQRVRWASANALGKIRDVTRVAPLLIKQLNDNWIAADVLREIGWQPEQDQIGAAYWCALGEYEHCIEIGAPAVPLLVEHLSCFDDSRRRIAAETLGKIGDRRAIGPLMLLLNDFDQDVRDAAAISLREIGWQPEKNQIGAVYWCILKEYERCIEIGEPAVEPLLKLLNTLDRNVAVQTLAKIGVPAIKPLVAQLRNQDEDVRVAVTEALVKIGTPAVGPLITRLKDRNKDIRRAATKALGEIGDARAVKPLAARLGDWQKIRGIYLAEDQVLIATQALVNIGAPAIEPLVGQLGHHNKIMRRATAEILGMIGDVQAIEPLIKRLSDSDADVRCIAANALERIGWQPEQDQIRVAYWAALGKYKHCVEMGALAVEPLVKQLSNSDWHVREAAAETLGKIGVPAVEPLVMLLRDRNKNVIRAAIIALVKIGTPAIQSLEKRMKSWNPNIRRMATEALTQIKETTSIPRIEAQLPIAQFVTCYQYSNNGIFDESFSIDLPDGEFLGECGIGISEMLETGERMLNTAFEIWLFDKEDIQTLTKILSSAYAFSNQCLHARMAPKGEIIMAQTGAQIILETNALRLEATVSETEYREWDGPAESAFEKLTVEINVWRRP